MRFTRPRTRLALFVSIVGAATVLPGMAPASAVPSTKVQNPGFEKGNCWDAFRTKKGQGAVDLKGTPRSGKRAARVAINTDKAAVAVVQKANCAIKVSPGKAYDISLYYKTTSARSAVMLFRRAANGKWHKWQYFPFHPGTGGKFQRAALRTPAVPAGTTQIRFAMGLAGAGTLTTDDYSVRAAKGKAPCTYGAACTKGRWDVKAFAANKQIRGIHAVLMYNGKVLLIAGSGNSKLRWNSKNFTTSVFDPKTNSLTRVKNPPGMYDMFCAGHVQLPDGRILVLGGTDDYGTFVGENGNVNQTVGWKGSKKSWIFNPRTNKYERGGAGSMIDGHWYPSATALGNGNIYAVGGYSAQRGGPGTPNGGNMYTTAAEVYSPKQRKWLRTGFKQTGINWATYPALIQTKENNKLFYTGASVFGAAKMKDNQTTRGAGFFNPVTGAWTAVNGLRDLNSRDQAASLLLPPAQDQKVMVIGGRDFTLNTPATNKVDIIDLDAKGRHWQAGPALPQGLVKAPGSFANDGAPMTPQQAGHGKTYVSAVILPNGKVFETGGSEGTKDEHVHEASMFDPKSPKRWVPMAADPVDRTYHSMALLLPDGRILAAGANTDAEWVKDETAFDTRLSIYTPSYLLRGGQPRLSVAKRGWTYGNSYQVASDQKVKSAALIRPSAVTHSSDPNQRSVALPVKALGGGKYSVKLNRNRNITPPGWYMLFVNNASGVPSVAQWVHVS